MTSSRDCGGYNADKFAEKLANKGAFRFGMAEQAINTIYLLGEQPDTLCTVIIRDLHQHTFDTSAEEQERPAESQPDEEGVSRRSNRQALGSPFKLAKLIFVIGHVAIKHIVYLELVEREFKRRKDEAAKGAAPSVSIYWNTLTVLRVLQRQQLASRWTRTTTI
jgi:condensin complex subunit 1